MSTRRPAFYALRQGGWRDYVTLLHLPYTAWHLSYVVYGAAVAPRFDASRLGETVLAFFLAVGLSAHALDELSGRPLQTAIPSRVLLGIAGVGVAGALALGVHATLEVSLWMLAFMAAGTFILLAYNLELFHGRFHSDAWFALGWGGFPALTGYFAQTGRIRLEAVLVAAACVLLSAAQRRLSTPVRLLRRKVAAVDGRMVLRGGGEARVTEETLRLPAEAALRALAVALSLLAAGATVARLRWP